MRANSALRFPLSTVIASAPCSSLHPFIRKYTVDILIVTAFFSPSPFLRDWAVVVGTLLSVKDVGSGV
jgi:hypothetical protein